MRQGVHILKYQNLEDLASDETYKFAYILGVNKIKGATAGTVLRPIGILPEALWRARTSSAKSAAGSIPRKVLRILRRF